MTATVLLRLDGPLQAWSTAAFADRPTMPFPTKSGLVGLIANAMGLTRCADIADIAALQTAVRADDHGHPVTDFQIAGSAGWRSANGVLHTGAGKIRQKGYLADAVFTAALTGPTSLIEAATSALARPARPLFLGRRCCPPAAPVLLGTSELPLIEALRAAPYHGHRPRPPRRYLAIADASPDRPADRWEDQPISFARDRRVYAPRSVVLIELTPRDGRDADEHESADAVWSDPYGLDDPAADVLATPFHASGRGS
jgi:CRISPR system Cascade subunit CasD